MQGLEEARRLYERYGTDMIDRLFPKWAGRIAVGLVGHGSECFGFDDVLSRDHDFPEGFCLWVDDETDRAIGVQLARAYRALPFKKRSDAPKSTNRLAEAAVAAPRPITMLFGTQFL